MPGCSYDSFTAQSWLNLQSKKPRDKMQTTAPTSLLSAQGTRSAGEVRQIFSRPVRLATPLPVEGSTTRCLIVCTHTLSALGLRSLLETNIAGASVTTAGTVDLALEAIAQEEHAPFVLVVLADLLDAESAAVAVERLHAATSAPTMVVSHCGSPSLFARLRHLGAQVVVGVDWTPAAMSAALLEAIAHDALPGGASAAPERSLPPLTERQRDVVELLLKGCSNKQIAHHLNLSCGTVKNYIFSLMRMMSVRSRLELVARVREFESPAS
ncbi:MAG TPA: response regulator transcription factor [Burkholderiaceae bacterium]|nr:response regulator transcription factor [Burkholderiaceae bacterium]